MQERFLSELFTEKYAILTNPELAALKGFAGKENIIVFIDSLYTVGKRLLDIY